MLVAEPAMTENRAEVSTTMTAALRVQLRASALPTASKSN